MRKLFVRQPVACAGSLRFALAIALFFLVLVFRSPANAQVTIVQLSDTHLGEANSPHAEENLRRAVDMINDRHPDAVVLSGDIGENPEQWQRAREILKGLKAHIYYAPGNHDVHSNDVAQYRRVFGPDYYSFHVKGVTFLVINSQFFGNYDQFGLQPLAPLSSQNQAEAEKMLAWLANPDLRPDRDNQGRHGNPGQNDDRQNSDRQNNDGQNNNGQGRDGDNGRKIIIGIQHIPVFRAENLLPDPKPYWVINEPYRSREMALLHQLGVKHMLVGHWHVGGVFEREGITWHVAPSTGRMLPWSGQLGFAIHTISSNGDVKTEFVSLGTQ